MIKSFKHKGLKRFFLTRDKSGIQPEHEQRLRLILAKMHTAHALKDLNFLGSNLHPLHHNREGQWSITIKKNWRITFVFDNGDIELVHDEDYHEPTRKKTIMHHPPHPGEVLKELYVEPLELSVTDLAKALKCARKTLSSILNGHAGISPLMAIKLGMAFDSTPESWLALQNQYDLWHEKSLMKEPLHIQKFYTGSTNCIQSAHPVT